jgi:hypothetical protein
MKKFLYAIPTLAILIVLTAQTVFSQSALQVKLEDLPGIISVKQIENTRFYTETYEIYFEQPLDHNNPDGKKFKQRMYLSHFDESLPIVLNTTGYNADTNRVIELAEILRNNNLLVEHRFFGKSAPEKIDWKYLTVEQAANDHHKIIETFKRIYNNKWITSGISKGGQTTIFHRYFYPDDVDASVAYVAPLNIAQEDPRIYSFLRSVGTQECRKKMIEFQREVLKRKKDLLPLFKNKYESLGYTYSLGIDEYIFEYVVLEYGFAFWQWQNETCEDIPPVDASNEVLFNHLIKCSPINYLSDQGIEPIAPFFYQAYAEIGYYGYDITDFRDLLTEIKEPTSKIFLPKGTDPEFNYPLMQKINTWVQKEGNNMLFIYGEIDTWSAPAVQLTGETNAIKMVKKGGAHRTRIKDFSDEEKEIIYSTLEEWLDIQISTE